MSIIADKIIRSITTEDPLSTLDFKADPSILFNSHFYFDYECFLITKSFFISDKNIKKFFKKVFYEDIDNALIRRSVYPSYQVIGMKEERVYAFTDKSILLYDTVEIPSIRPNNSNKNFYKHSFSLFCMKDRFDAYKEYIEKYLIKKETDNNVTHEMSIICQDSTSGFYTEPFQLELSEVDIDLNYNDDFAPVYSEIIDKLNNTSKGLILLHSAPGNGKSYLLRDLSSRIKKKEIIYVTPDIAQQMSNPAFVSFFVTKPNSIFIIEDAENILKSRKHSSNQAVANLLNISDGLLSDALKIQIVCTFNTDISEIDPALRRPGRLIAEYKFEPLVKEKAQKLIDKLFPEDKFTIVHPMTLSEIYNFKEKKYNIKDKKEEIGFSRYNNKN